MVDSYDVWIWRRSGDILSYNSWDGSSATEGCVGLEDIGKFKVDDCDQQNNLLANNHSEQLPTVIIDLIFKP
jgi:hypothetical protein